MYGIIVFNDATYKMAGDKINEMKKKNLPLIIKI